MRRPDHGPPGRASYAAPVRFAVGRLFALPVASMLVFAACATGGSPAPPSGADQALFDGQAVYERQCASCHRANGSGGRGPRLNRDRAVANYATVEDLVGFLRVGRGAMPAFDGRLTDEELTAVARYAREVLANSE